MFLIITINLGKKSSNLFLKPAKGYLMSGAEQVLSVL